MPTYEYVCGGCGHEFEEFQSITAKPLRKCPECGKQQLKRLIGTGAGVIFKGSGFYETDYRSDSYKKAKSEAEKPADSAGKSDGDAKKSTEKKAETGSSDTHPTKKSPAKKD